MAPALKKTIGKLIPYPLIHTGRRIVHYGRATCVVCGNRHGRGIDSGYGFPVLEELQVVGGLMRRGDACPICHSSSRERLIWFYLSRYVLTAGQQPQTAHMAPEKGLSLRLSAQLGSRYQAYDLEPSRYRHLANVLPANLENLPLPSGQTDLFLCNHVLEHIYDLPKALSEVRRVLAPDGLALMQVPIALSLSETRDGGQAMDKAERIRQFGQDDHVRLFSRQGYITTLEQAGFAVTPYRAFEDDAAVAARWSLDPFEELMVIRPA